MSSRVWGVSRLRDLRVCPGWYVAKYETKKWIETPSPAMERGTKVHRQLEEAIKYGVLLPKELDHVAPYAYGLCDAKKNGAMVEAELKFGLDVDGNPVDFFKAPGLRARLALDVGANMFNRALAVDWKTGRWKPEHNDDALFYGASLCMLLKPASCIAQYIYVDNMEQSFDIEIEKPDEIIDSYLDKFEYADHYLDGVGKNGMVRLVDPPLNPGNQCKWCGNVECENNRNDEAKAISYAALANKTQLFKL